MNPALLAKPRILKEKTNEAYFSAKSPEARPQTRLPCPHVYPCRQVDYQGPSSKGKKTPFCLIGKNPATYA
jgi:hypothetical protein